VDLVLPALDGCGDLAGRRAGGVDAFAAGLAGVPALHDDVERAADPHEEDGQALQAFGAPGEDVAGPGVRVVVTDVDDDVDALAARCGDRVVERGVGGFDEVFEVGALAAGPQADAGTVARGCDVADPDVDAQVQPGVVEGFLDGLDDGRLTGAWGAVEDDDRAGFVTELSTD
jgi:hypothetical protein